MGKEETLKENGTYNPNHEKVKSRLFANSQFFDARDIVQVKYEMLREVSNGEKTVTQISQEYGLSREALYENKKVFEKEGITALIPKKKGPKGSYKLREGEGFIKEYINKKPDAKAREIAMQLEAETGTKLHPKTIRRYLSKKK